MVLYLKFTYGSQFSEEKNDSEIRYLDHEVSNKYKRSIFFETPCRFLKIVTIEYFGFFKILLSNFFFSNPSHPHIEKIPNGYYVCVCEYLSVENDPVSSNIEKSLECGREHFVNVRSKIRSRDQKIVT